MDEPINWKSVALLGVLAYVPCFAIVAALVRRWRRGEEILAYEARRRVPWGGAELLLLVLLFLTIQLAAGGVIWLTATLRALSAGAEFHVDDEVVMPDLNSLTGAAIAVSISLVTFLIGVAIVRLVARASWDDIGLSLRHLPGDALRGVVAFGAIAAPIYSMQLALTQFFPSEHPLVELWDKNPGPLTVALLLVAAVVVAPLAEEFLFRGLLQGWLENVGLRYQMAAANMRSTPAETNASAPSDDSPVPAIEDAPRLRGRFAATPILISSGLFAAAHWSHGPDPIPLFFLAVVLGFLYQRTHRLWPSIIVHACLNGISLVLLLMSLE